MRIPFQLPDVSDVHEGAGFLYLEEDFLVFEFHILEWGISPGDTTTVKAERGVIDGIQAQRGLFRDRLLIATGNVQLLRAVPGPHVTEIVLRTKRRHRPEVAAFVEKVRAWKGGRPA